MYLKLIKYSIRSQEKKKKIKKSLMREVKL